VKPKGRAVFLDRDDTIILDHGYLKEARQVCLLAGAGEALATIKGLGFALILISNQSGIGRGLITPEQAEQVHQALVERLAEYEVRLDAVFYCPHTPADACRCRKPSPEPLLRAARELDLDLAHSFMVGDQVTDMEAGKRAGCWTILLSTAAGGRAQAATAGDGESDKYQKPDAVARDWAEVVRHLLHAEARCIA
jgi:D-glycero-D-manno-heptose 1,7-bisphosphate phosphatase